MTSDSTATPPSPDVPLRGGCLCGTVRFEIAAPFADAGYCHCYHCQRRTGTGASAAGIVDATAFAIVSGADAIRSFQPEGGKPKAFCVGCGGHLYAGDRDHDAKIAVRLGSLDEDPGIRPRWRQWIASAVPWEAIPDDGLPRYEGTRPT